MADQLDREVPNYQAVTPEHKAKLKGLVAFYMKKPHPFTACVRDNTKRFGADRAKRVCAVLKDIGEGTTKWRKGPKKASEDPSDYWSEALWDAAGGDLDNLLGMMEASEGEGGMSDRATYAGDRFRMIDKAPELRDGDNGMPTLVGTLAVFNEWTEVNSMYEGHFMERLNPGSFDTTIREDRERMRPLFQHGQDPQVGKKPLGPIHLLAAGDEHVRYEVPLLDTVYNRELIPGLEQGLYGSSFRFMIDSEDFDRNPLRSDYNPDAIPERSVTLLRMKEFGPVTFPQYRGTHAGLRSVTDDVIGLYRMEPEEAEKFSVSIPRDLTTGELGGRVALADEPSGERNEEPVEEEPTGDASEEAAAAEELATEDVEAPAEPEERSAEDEPEDQKEPAERSAAADSVRKSEGQRYASRDAAGTTRTEEPQVSDQDERPVTTDLAYEDRLQRCDDIRGRLADIDEQFNGRTLPDEVQREFDGLIEELPRHEAVIADVARRRERMRVARVGQYADRHEEGEHQTRDRPGDFGDFSTRAPRSEHVRADIWELTNVRALSDEGRSREYKERVKRVVEQSFFPHPNADQARCKEHMLRLLSRFEADDQSPEFDSGNLERYARRVLSTGSPVYLRTFQRGLRGQPLGNEHFRALSLTGGQGGFAVPYTLDPTIIPTSNSSVNPWRALGRVETITTDAWKGVTSAGVTASRGTEAAEAADAAAGTMLVQPSVDCERVHLFIPFSFEIGQDWGSLQSEMATIIQDAKDDEEASAFTTGTGVSPQPQGIVTALAADSTATVVAFAGTALFAIADLYSIEQTLGARFRARAQWVMNRFYMNKARQFDTAGGSGVWLDGLQPGLANQVPTPGNVGARLLGYPVNESTAMSSSLASAQNAIVFGDFRYFLIVDRIGLNLDLIPHLFGASNRPTGQRGLYAFWRNNCKVLSTSAFKMGRPS